MQASTTISRTENILAQMGGEIRGFGFKNTCVMNLSVSKDMTDFQPVYQREIVTEVD